MSPTDAPPGLDAACDADDDAFVRRVNLLEILAEDSPETAPPPEEAARTWTEARIQKHYRTIGANGLSRDEVQNRVLTEKKVESLRSDPEVGKATTEDETLLPRREQTETTSAPAGSSRRPKRVRSNRASDFPEPDETTFKRWFPGFERANARMSNSATDANDETAFQGPFTKKTVQKPKARVLCWPNAGNAEDVFTSERARVDGALRTIPSPLIRWCQTNRAELFAVQLPGRAARSSEPALRCARDAARALMPIVARRFFSSTAKTKRREDDDDVDDVDDNDSDSASDSDSDSDDAKEIPWIVVGHSVGSWCAFEFVRLAASLGFHAPALACLSGFPAPDIQIERRPWRVNESLDDAAFKEECRAWGMDEAAFGEKIWPVFEPLLRADFTLFDEYEYDENSHRRGVEDEREKEKQKVFPRLLTLRGTRDERITREAVSAWRRFSFVDEKEGKKNETEKTYRHVELVDAPHLLLTHPAFKSAWLNAVADALDAVVR
jgi:surfactin synthase thioesterase subunit